jgi:hypothetical protein
MSALARGCAARVIGDIRLRGRDLVHHDVVFAPLDCALDLGSLVARTNDEAVILGTDSFVDVEGDAHTLAASTLLSALAQEVDRPVGCPGLGFLPEPGYSLVDFAEQGFVACLTREALLECHHALVTHMVGDGLRPAFLAPSTG